MLTKAKRSVDESTRTIQRFIEWKRHFNFITSEMLLNHLASLYLSFITSTFCDCYHWWSAKLRGLGASRPNMLWINLGSQNSLKMRLKQWWTDKVFVTRAANECQRRAVEGTLVCGSWLCLPSALDFRWNITMMRDICSLPIHWKRRVFALRTDRQIDLIAVIRLILIPWQPAHAHKHGK